MKSVGWQARTKELEARVKPRSRTHNRFNWQRSEENIYREG
jgi:hypothetical protein